MYTILHMFIVLGIITVYACSDTALNENTNKGLKYQYPW